MIYGIEMNFYGSGGSKLNETARNFEMLSQEDSFDGFTFVWFTDGIGWNSARGNLREIFEIMDTIYSIDDMENGIVKTNDLIKGDKSYECTGYANCYKI